MSDGKKFTKTDSNLTPEERLDEIERKYGVIQQRIQAYDQVLVEFANINSDLNAIKQSMEMNKETSIDYHKFMKERIDILNSKILAIHKNNESFISHVDNQSKFNDNISFSLQEACGKFYRDIELLKMHVANVDVEQANTHEMALHSENRLSQIDTSIGQHNVHIQGMIHDHKSLKDHVQFIDSTLSARIDQLLASLQDMPQFNEWATKIYIKVCNEINEKQKAFYQELDKRSQQLREQLASDPYTAESVKKILKDEMDALAMDGKNAYIKATNASQQIQLLEKKVENINLILKKYELSK